MYYCRGIEQTSLVCLGDNGTLFHLCLANHSAVSKPHPTEGDEIYAGCGIPGCCEVCCAVCTPLCGGRCAACLCCLLFFCCRDLAFSNVYDMFLRNKQKRVRAHPSTPCTAYNLCVPCLGKIQAARGSLYSTRILFNYLPLPGACVASISAPLGIVCNPYTHNN